MTEVSREAFDFAARMLPKMVRPEVIRDLAVHLEASARAWECENGKRVDESTAGPVAGAGVVHLLSAGRVSCGFTLLPPREWPAGHKWEGRDRFADVTCKECRRLSGLSTEGKA